MDYIRICINPSYNNHLISLSTYHYFSYIIENNNLLCYSYIKRFLMSSIWQLIHLHHTKVFFALPRLPCSNHFIFLCGRVIKSVLMPIYLKESAAYWKSKLQYSTLYTRHKFSFFSFTVRKRVFFPQLCRVLLLVGREVCKNVYHSNFAVGCFDLIYCSRVWFIWFSHSLLRFTRDTFVELCHSNLNIWDTALNGSLRFFFVDTFICKLISNLWLPEKKVVFTVSHPGRI